MRLRDTLAACKGKWLVSQADCPEIRELFRDYEILDFQHIHSMVQKHNLCAQLPIDLHAKVMAEKNAMGQVLSEYITNILTKHFEGSKPMATTKTLAFQIPEELDVRIRNYLAAEKERTGKKISQREFIVGLIVQALPCTSADLFFNRKPVLFAPANCHFA